MKKMMYAIKDQKSMVFDPPILCHNRGDAVRMFSTVFDNQKSMMARFPNDYMIFELGEYDDNTGVITVHEIPQEVCKLEDLAPKEVTNDNQ